MVLEISETTGQVMVLSEIMNLMEDYDIKSFSISPTLHREAVEGFDADVETDLEKFFVIQFKADKSMEDNRHIFSINIGQLAVLLQNFEVHNVAFFVLR